VVAILYVTVLCIVIGRLPDPDQQRCIDAGNEFKPLGIDTCPCEFPRTEWMDDAGALRDRQPDHRQLLANIVGVMLAPARFIGLARGERGRGWRKGWGRGLEWSIKQRAVKLTD